MTTRAGAEVPAGQVEPQFRHLVESLDAVVWRADARTFHFTYVSHEAEALLGYPPDRWTSEPAFWEAHLHPDDRAPTVESCRTATARGEDHALEYRMVASDGRVVWVRDVVRVLSEGGEPRELVGLLLDITHLKQTEEQQGRLQAAIRRAAREWQTTFDAVESPLLVLDVSGRVRRLNRPAAELAGRPFAEILGRPVDDIPAEPWQALGRAARLVAGSRAAYSGQCGDGGGRTWDLAANLVASDELLEERIVASLREVTGIVKLQESLRHQETMAAMGSLVAGVAHEVRNPLFAMSATLDAFEARFGGRPEYERYVGTLRGELLRLTQLMKDLLDYGRPVAVEPRPEPIAKTLDDALRTVSGQAAAAGVRLQMSLPDGDTVVAIDPGPMTQVLRNLLENAIQHSPRGGLVRLIARPEPGSATFAFAVEDGGKGFEREDLPRIFDPFFTRRRGGTGLGLSIVQRVVEAHGGRVDAGNRPDGGAVVTVRVPLRRGDAAPPAGNP